MPAVEEKIAQRLMTLRVVPAEHADPYLDPERQAQRAELAEAWVAYIKSGLRGEVDLLADGAPGDDAA